MNNYNYRVSVNMLEDVLNIRFAMKLNPDMDPGSIMLQAIFTQRQTDRRFPMKLSFSESEAGPELIGEANVELPYVFVHTPRHKVTLTFAFWQGTREVILDEQPFPINKDRMARPDEIHKRNPLMFGLYTLGLPAIIGFHYLKNGRNRSAALKAANETVYRNSGCSYSPRQRKTDYFRRQYEKFTAKGTEKDLSGKPEILFLSERLPEKKGNLRLVQAALSGEPSLKLTEFINTKTVDQLSKKELRQCASLCASARVIVLEDFYPQLHSLNLRRETKVVQLWHACGVFKIFGFSRMGMPGGAPQSSMNHRNYDFVSVSSERICGIYSEAFGISKNRVKGLGVPRTDCLFDEAYKTERKTALYEKYPLLRGKKVVLFAPTYRGDGNKDAYYPEDAFPVDAFIDQMPSDTLLIVKHHPFIHQPVASDRKNVLDLSDKEHINDLMLISDLLITDYSSCIFEAALLDLPMIFYAFDKRDYLRDRDSYFPFEHMVPGQIVTDFDSLCNQATHILSGRGIDEEKYREFRQAFLSSLDGKSTERIADEIQKMVR